MTTSVIIPVWNGLAFLQKNLPAVIAAHPTEIIVVDDASPDTSAAYIKTHYPQVRLLHHPHNTRFPQSVNDGVAVATSDIVILLNQDVRPHSDFIKATLPHFQNPQIFAVTFNEQTNSWAKAEYRHGFIEFTNGPKDNQVHTSFWANGGSSAFRKDLWSKLGGFDTVFSPGYFEDFDLCWRARNLGYTIIWEPSAHVSHTTESTNSVAFDPTYLRRIKERNYLLAHWKNLSLRQLLVHKCYLLIRIIRHPGYIIPVFMAVKYLPRILKFRFFHYV